MIFAVIASFGFLLAQDAAGTYKLTGTKVRYTSLLRQTSTLTAHDTYGLGLTFPLLTSVSYTHLTLPTKRIV